MSDPVKNIKDYLIRFDVGSHDRKAAAFFEAEKGYWTPWYIANRRIGEVRNNLYQAQYELTAAKAEIERLQGRVAIMEEFVADAQLDAWRALDPDYVPSAVESAMKSLLHRAATITQEIDPDDIELSAWLLRKQAEAVDKIVEDFDDEIHHPDFTQSQVFLCGARDHCKRYAQRLRQQAEDAEMGEE